MLTELEAAELLLDQYNGGKAFDKVMRTGEVSWAYKICDGYTIIAFEGSKDFVDWKNDFDVLIYYDPYIGLVHAGFDKYMQAVVVEVMKLPGPYIVIGHSLGAARASNCVAHLVVRTEKVLMRYCFGEPNTSIPFPFRMSASELAASVPGRSRATTGATGHDDITDWPTCPPFNCPTHRIPLLAKPPADPPPDILWDKVKWDLFKYHNIRVYIDALKAEGGV